ncbi:hypothetical protein AgCh_022990 [Apium graveolens]
MKIPNTQLRKLDDRSKPVINLGKEPGTKAYRLYDPESKQLHVSRDVVFEEKKVWPWEKQQEEVTVAQQSYFTESRGSVSTEVSSGESSQSDSEPRRFRLLSDIYNDAEEVELGEELFLMGIDEPVNYEQACKKKEWKTTMEKEIESIENNNTEKLTELPPGSNAIDLKWIYKLKKDTNGIVVKHKARLVAKGYVQVHGVDFEEIFAPVTRMETVRLILALSAKHGWEVHHLDVKSAFLNDVLDEVVYVSQPEGFVKEGQEHMVYQLYKALYGLRQAPRAWYAKLSRCLEEMGLTRCPYEHAVYTKKEGNKSLIVAVYIDDLLITNTSTSIIERFKKEMSTHFDMSDLGKLAYYLGIEVQQSGGLIKLKQTAYAKKMLEKASLNDCNPTKYPMDPKLLITKDEGGVAVNSTEFKSLVGGLRYLVHTRPDLAYAVGIVSRFMERPTQMHLNAVKRILRYVKGTLNYGLVYSKDSKNNMISGYSDSDHGGNLEDRKSTAGMAFYLNECLISWVSQKQKCVALSSCEADLWQPLRQHVRGYGFGKVGKVRCSMKGHPGAQDASSKVGMEAFGLSNNLLGWILFGMFGLIWSLYFVYTSGLDEDEESGLSLLDELLYCQKKLELDPAKINVNGGAMVLAHPLGVTDVVNTVGCGDSFVAAIAFGYINNLPLVHTLTVANDVGAAIAMGSNAGRNVETMENVMKLLKRSTINEDDKYLKDVQINGIDGQEVTFLSKKGRKWP